MTTTNKNTIPKQRPQQDVYVIQCLDDQNNQVYGKMIVVRGKLMTALDKLTVNDELLKVIKNVIIIQI